MSAPAVDRRTVLLGLTAVAALGTAACTSGKGAADSGPDSGGGGTGDGSDGSDGTSDGSDGSDGTSDGTEGSESVTTDWAVGGTALLAATYDVDFAADCAQTCALTLGPCYAETLERQDIAEGVEGLPTRIAFQVVDTDCQPMAGVVVDIWHCSPAGLYSGSDAADMCTEGDSAARSARWFRGTQITDADGMVQFDSCMPGWYPSRAVHIHFQVEVEGRAAVISQLGFEEALLSDVFDNHPTYSPFGQPDTSNATDSILSTDASLLFSWRQAEDGALVVWKRITVDAAGSAPSC